jgi:hypothetical protein
MLLSYADLNLQKRGAFSIPGPPIRSFSQRRARRRQPAIRGKVTGAGRYVPLRTYVRARIFSVCCRIETALILPMRASPIHRCLYRAASQCVRACVCARVPKKEALLWGWLQSWGAWPITAAAACSRVALLCSTHGRKDDKCSGNVIAVTYSIYDHQGWRDDSSMGGCEVKAGRMGHLWTDSVFDLEQIDVAAWRQVRCLNWRLINELCLNLKVAVFLCSVWE